MDGSDAIARFTRMEDGTKEDCEIIERAQEPFVREVADRVLEHLGCLGGSYGGMLVDRLTHSLQTATRAHRDGRDEEYVVCALLHDIGDTLGPSNHADVAATLLEPYVSEENHWVIKHHGIFQGYYFFHHVGLDRDGRDAFSDHPYYQACVDFCHLYDQNSFDTDYDSEPLEFFVPMVERVFAAPQKPLYKEAMVDTDAA